MSDIRHFTALKVSTGWAVYKGEPDNRGCRACYNTFDHSDSVYDYCNLVASVSDATASIHFDLRGYES
jgi:hypothetical protein